MDDLDSSANARPSQDRITIKPFANQGHYTPVHDGVFDIIMPRISGNKFKILMFVTRKTRGWKKLSDRLGVGQIQKGTGIASDRTVRTCCAEMAEEGLLIEVTPHDSANQLGKEWALNDDYEMEVAVKTRKAPAKTTPGKNYRGGSGKNYRGSEDKPPVKITGDNNHPSPQETDPQESSGKSDDLPGDPAESSAPGAPPEEGGGDSQDGIPEGTQDLKRWAVAQLAQRIKAARARGRTVHPPTDDEKKRLASMFAACAAEGDGEDPTYEVDTLVSALDYMVAKAAGEVEDTPKAWCSFRTALDRVLDSPHNTPGSGGTDFKRGFEWFFEDDESRRELAAARRKEGYEWLFGEAG